MRKIIFTMLSSFMFCQFALAQANLPNAEIKNISQEEKELLELSKSKWIWMSEKNLDSLNTLFADKSVFVHMGGSWGKMQELEIIKSGGIWYKKSEIFGASVNTFGNTAILLNDIDLMAVVGGNEIVNPFMVTEVYVKTNGRWQLASLTFSKLMRPAKMK